MTTRLAVWSGPRNISTALMRSWENRPDCMVVDEPLYAHFLACTGIHHPGREEVLAVGETDWRAVVDSLLAPPPDGIAVFYQKHMAHHLVADVSHDWIGQLTNVFLIREPREVLASYVRSREQVTLDDLGFPQQVKLYDDLRRAGRDPLVIDAADFLRDPERFLRRMCEEAGVGFTDAMLHWPAGPRDSDGVWGRYWYDAVWKSTGFAPYRPREVALPERLEPLAEECRPLYDRLWQQRWTP